MEKTLVTAAGIGVIAFLYWFFFDKKEPIQETRAAWTVNVSGGYQPATIVVPKGKRATITFTRTDPNSCLEDVVVEDFKIKTFLPLNKPVMVTISPTKAGTYGMHCGMNMFHGKIIVI